MKLFKLLFPASLIDCIKLHERHQGMKKKVVSSLTVFVVLLLTLPLAVVLHNLFYLVFGFEDIVFIFLTLSLIFFLPIYFLYFLVVLVSYLIAKRRYGKKLCWKI